MNTRPICSINWLTAVGTMFLCPCKKPRNALMTQTKNRLGAIAM